ncbi:HvfC family RiPP maturation protein [Catenovulum sediminis]|uniref:DNA-binding domain-containing protein n=1 Tax=Catenovulum sediminis TaxID=1740262 RepID=A0ABV1RF82_9ALTE
MHKFQQVQLDFAKTIRNPLNSGKCSTLPEQRVAVYQELFINNMQDSLTTVFPVLAKIYGEVNWPKVVRQFFQIHKSRSPYFSDLASEFIDFLSEEYDSKDAPPFYLYLAHYEWLELSIAIKQASYKRSKIKNLETQFFVLSDVAQMVSYPFPVHKITVDYQPQAEQDTTYLVVYRDFNERVQFLEINAVLAFTLDLVDKSVANTFSALLGEVTKHLPQISATQLENGLKTRLSELAEVGIIVNKK